MLRCVFQCAHLFCALSHAWSAGADGGRISALCAGICSPQGQRFGCRRGGRTCARLLCISRPTALGAVIVRVIATTRSCWADSLSALVLSALQRFRCEDIPAVPRARINTEVSRPDSDAVSMVGGPVGVSSPATVVASGGTGAGEDDDADSDSETQGARVQVTADAVVRMEVGPLARTECAISQRVCTQGYLTKRGAVVRSWRRRFFRLTNEYLLYYRSPSVCLPLCGAVWCQYAHCTGTITGCG